MSKTINESIAKTMQQMEKKMKSQLEEKLATMWGQAIDSLQDKLKDKIEEVSNNSHRSRSRSPSDINQKDAMIFGQKPRSTSQVAPSNDFKKSL